uniref:Retrovirus-related Pol polyprotein from transposon TNT 1-94 n=1 Tax=Cajanus cajan TaxID=3821 RepID=A0A151TRZ1_CAJCA|nr:Retrovirus-related Pol polyprotein from transposon TNT 1-94 [Cajanus cajan]
MGNDMACKTIGIGTIQIKMHDGVIRTLTEVRHVPYLKKNLISVGVLDTKDFKYNVEGGVMEISKGSTVVNGVAKRINRTLLEKERCLLSNVGLTKSFWAEAVNRTCYLVNRSPSTAIGCKTPIEVWSTKRANYSILRVFGYAYYHVNEGKLEPRSRKGLFMGYRHGVKGYRIWSPSEKKIILSRDVVFDESHMFHMRLEFSILGKIKNALKQVEVETTSSIT